MGEETAGRARAGRQNPGVGMKDRDTTAVME